MNARLHIQVATRNGITFLKNSFCTQPFKLADITEDEKVQALQLMIMSSSPGILDNDEYDINVDLDQHCSLELRTQSYQRIFQMKQGAKQSMMVRMQEGSSLIFLPHPCVPHESSIFSSRSKFYLSKGCNLIWGEVLTCGRMSNGEIFRLSRYHSVTEIFFEQRLILKENLLVAPTLISPKVIGQLEGYTHQASFVCIGRSYSKTLVESILDLLSTEKNVSFGISTFPNGLVVRLMGYKAEQLHGVLRVIAECITSSQIISVAVEQQLCSVENSSEE